MSREEFIESSRSTSPTRPRTSPTTPSSTRGSGRRSSRRSARAAAADARGGARAGRRRRPAPRHARRGRLRRRAPARERQHRPRRQLRDVGGTLLDHERPIVVVAEPGPRGRGRGPARADRRSTTSPDTSPAGCWRSHAAPSSSSASSGSRRHARRAARRRRRRRSCSTSAPRASGSRSRIDGTVNIPLSRLAERLGALPQDRRIVVHCASGYRSAIAAGLLRRAGFTRVADLIGGLAAWASARRSSRLRSVGLRAP